MEIFKGLASYFQAVKTNLLENEVRMGELLRKNFLVLVVLFAGFIIHISTGTASASEPLDDAQQLFFNQFRYAVQAQDTSQLIRLTHSGSLACVAEEDREYYYARILDGLVQVFGRRQAVQAVSSVAVHPEEKDFLKESSKVDNAGWLAIPEIKSSRDRLKGIAVHWPVMPELRIIVQYKVYDQTAVASLYLAKDNNEWKWIHICTN